MKKVMLVLTSIAVLFASGCATKNYVKTQVDPLSDRIGRIEARLNAMDGKLDQAVKTGQLSTAEAKAARAEIAEAKDMAKKAEADAARAAGDADKAAAAAKNAEEAAKNAEKTAAKTEKMFHLQQKK
ncbi:MAG TPA: hypothetical protein VK185_00865 [Candidatus Bathyarchaeia archaeon]|jgi:methyl-accepting chemotaxis protein|nr:hypothetical protein [Candidatus Bathyarchaeia archaeon]HLO09256.1 hypothetical protein [Desulfobacteria bacterium]